MCTPSTHWSVIPDMAVLEGSYRLCIFEPGTMIECYLKVTNNAGSSSAAKASVQGTTCNRKQTLRFL